MGRGGVEKAWKDEEREREWAFTNGLVKSDRSTWNRTARDCPPELGHLLSAHSLCSLCSLCSL